MLSRALALSGRCGKAGYSEQINKDVIQNAKDCHSLLKKYLTKEVVDQLKDKKTKLGATLLDVIQSGSFPLRMHFQ